MGSSRGINIGKVSTRGHGRLRILGGSRVGAEHVRHLVGVIALLVESIDQGMKIASGKNTYQDVVELGIGKGLTGLDAGGFFRVRRIGKGLGRIRSTLSCSVNIRRVKRRIGGQTVGSVDRCDIGYRFMFDQVQNVRISIKTYKHSNCKSPCQKQGYKT